MTRWITIATAAALALSLLGPAPARADGLPSPLDTSRSGVGNESQGWSGFAIEADRGTTVIKVDADAALIERRLELRGRYAIPGVAYDGSVGGLSHDGDTLVLIRPRIGFPRERTQLAIIDTERWRVFDRVNLEGDFSFDAISPDGSVVYLVHYTDRRDPRQYEVRAYDVVPGGLRPDPIVDTTEVELTMRGNPVTRTTSPDGRIEYTLYDGAGATPFVHALDVEEGTAVCIAVESLDPRHAGGATLALDESGETLTVAAGSRGPVAEIDTGSGSVREVEPSEADPGSGGGGMPTAALIALAVLAVAGGVSLLARRRSRARQTAAAAEAIGELDFEPRSESPPKPDRELTGTG